jgi:hypothetical protein
MARYGYSQPELHVWVTKIAEEEATKEMIAEANRRTAPLTPDRNRELDLLTTPPQQ